MIDSWIHDAFLSWQGGDYATQVTWWQSVPSSGLHIMFFNRKVSTLLQQATWLRVEDFLILFDWQEERRKKATVLKNST